MQAMGSERLCSFIPGVLAVALALLGGALAPAPALALPEGRVYEMVSPPYKGGYDAAEVEAVAPDGESVAFGSLGVFAGIPWDNIGNLYLARRGPAGWVTSSLMPPPVNSGKAAFSAGLTSVLDSAFLEATNAGAPHSGQEVFLLHDTAVPDTAASWSVYGGIVLKEGAAAEGGSADLCHVVLGHTGELLPEATATHHQFYDLAEGCGGEEPSLRLVAVRNRLGPQSEPEVINRICPVELGVEVNYSDQEQNANFNAVSADGREIFFTTAIESVGGCREGAVTHHQLFVRVGGSRTLEVSRPLEPSRPFGGCEAGGVAGEVPCEGAAARASAYFKGASEDGSRVFFTTKAPLVGEDKDTGNDLYMARIGCREGEAGCEAAQRQVTSLVQVSHASSGEPAEVTSVVRVAPDGRRVYFFASGVLSEAPNAEGQLPVKGAENLYVYDTNTGRTAFITDRGTVGAASSTADGGFLVFTSTGRLVRDDTDTAADVYRYDAVTGTLQRVSTGEAGYDANGNNSAFDATILGGVLNSGEFGYLAQELNTRAMSADGSRIVFETAEPLSPHAKNGLSNVYEWHQPEGSPEGQVSLVSSGESLTADKEATISPSGHDIFFLTSQGLVPQDTDGQYDIYDARLGGGFPPPPAPRQPCAGDACQGPLTNPAPLLVPGSVSQAPGQNLTAPPPTPTVNPKPKPKSPAKCRRGRVRKKRRCVTNAGARSGTIRRAG
jgi:hypothetical protein